MEARRLIERFTELPAPRVDPSRPLVPCPLCGARSFRTLGVRGNREHAGADRSASPHLWTNVARCTACDFVYANPPIPEAPELERSHYASAERYAAVRSPGQAGRMFKHRIALIRRYVRGGRLLDIGAGKGEFLREARRAGFDVLGVEPQEGLAAFARSEYGLPVRTGRLGDGVDVPGAFDVITLNHVLEHLEAPRELLEVARRRLRPKGVIFVEVPNVDAHLARATDLWFRARGRDWSCRLSPVHAPFHSFGYTPKSLARVLDASGFDVLDLTTRTGRDRGVGSGRSRAFSGTVSAAFLAFSLLGNRELLLAVARPL